MKKIHVSIVIVTLFVRSCFAGNSTIKAEFFAPLACAVVMLPCVDFLSEFTETVVKDLEFTKQFVITLKTNDNRFPASIIKECAALKIPFALFLKQSDTVIDWWLYDALSGSKIAAKRYIKTGAVARGWAHQVVDMVWETLTSRPGFFSTKITYCQESGLKRGISLKALCIADYDGTHEQVILDEKTVLLAPRWHDYRAKPVIFYSEETMKNTRLLSVNLNQETLVASNNPGINMLIDFNKSGTKAVYSASDLFGYSQIVLVDSKGITPITSYKANSLGPVFAEDGKKIYFYCDAFNKMPQICMYDCGTKNITQITKTGYNFGPAYCAHTGQIAYTSMKNKYMQIFLFDPQTGIHQQLTTDQSHKEDCSWSPGGDHLLVCVTRDTGQCLALYNVITRSYTYLTDTKKRCSDPHWSLPYKEFPVLFE